MRYPNAVTIDVGWYPESLEVGEFVIRVVREPDWDVPLFVDSRSSVDGLLTALKGGHFDREEDLRDDWLKLAVPGLTASIPLAASTHLPCSPFSHSCSIFSGFV